MTLEINLGRKKEKRLMRDLKMEHPIVRGHIRLNGSQKQIDRIISNIPDFERQAINFTKIQLKRGKK